MKRFLLFALVLLAITRVNSQSFSLATADGTPIASGETIYISGIPTEEIVIELHVTNTSTEAKDVLARKARINVPEGSSDVFCWGLCFPPFVMIAPEALNIAAGATNTEFSGHYTSNLIYGQAEIRYSFFDSHNTNDSVYVNVVFVPSTLTLGAEGAGIQCNQTVSVSGVYTEEVIFETAIKNNGEAANFIVRKKEVNMVNGTTSYFCWGACFPPSVSLSPGLAIAAGETSNEFSAHYTANQISGVSTVTYSVINEANTQDSIWFHVAFDGHASGAGATEVAAEVVVKTYPNPVTEKVNFSYNLPNVAGTAQIRISDLTGALVKTLKLEGNKGSQTVFVSDLNAGLYLYSVVQNGKVLSSTNLTVLK